jgi:acetyltransferase-like isoleucine patch superfamily enzyme
MRWSAGKRAIAFVQAVVRRLVWGMDIASSARIEPSAYIDRTWPKGVHIGSNVYIAEHAVVLTHDMVRGLYLDTWIGARTRLGQRCVIMPGLTVGEDCVVAPGAVVVKDMAPSSYAEGNPAVVTSREVF